MRVFIGLEEIANIAATYASAFRVLGCETRTVVWHKHPFYSDARYDAVLDNLLDKTRSRIRHLPRPLAFLIFRILEEAMLISQFLRSLMTCEVFVIVFGTSFLSGSWVLSLLPSYWDYAIVRLFGRQLISVFLGDDVRYWYAYDQEVRSLGAEDDVRPYLEYLKHLACSSNSHLFSVKIARVRAAERYASLILSQPGIAQLQTRPYMRMNIPLDLSRYRFNIPDHEVPLVVHAPSDRRIKGTEYVLVAVEQLKQEGLHFEFRLLENVSNEEVRRTLFESDVVIDQVFGETVGTLALESMASGNVVLARYLPQRAAIPQDCPVVNVTAATLVARLREVILDRDLRRRLAYAGRRYVEEHHGHVQVVQQILEWLRPGGIRKYDFVPTFYQDHFDMPSELWDEERRRTPRTLRLRQLVFHSPPLRIRNCQRSKKPVQTRV